MELLRTENRVCETHGEYAREVYRMGSGEWDQGCPKCFDEAQAKFDAMEKRRLEDLEHDRRSRFLINANIEPMYHNSTIENFVVETDEQKKAVVAINRLISGEVKKVLLIGSNGTGKTHLACAAIHALKYGKIMSMFEISAIIRSSFTNHKLPQELEILDGLAKQQILVIDEVGRTKGSDPEINWLSYIIDKRHTRGLRTIIISNKHLRKDCKSNGCPDCIENYLADDMISRLCEDGLIVKFAGPDYRRKK